jgi:hypothetical protein
MIAKCYADHFKPTWKLILPKLGKGNGNQMRGNEVSLDLRILQEHHDVCSRNQNNPLIINSVNASLIPGTNPTATLSSDRYDEGLLILLLR